MDSNFQLIDVSKLVYAEWNYKEDGTNKQIDKLVNNIKRNGLIVNLNVREISKDKFEVIDGNHRLKAIKQITDIKKVLCYNHGKLEESEAKRKCIELNESRFETNTLKLAEIYKELSDKYTVDDLALTCFHGKSDIEDLVKLTNFTWSSFDNKYDEQTKNDDKKFEILLEDLAIPIDEDLFYDFIDLCKKLKSKSEPKLHKMFDIMLRKELEKQTTNNA